MYECIIKGCFNTDCLIKFNDALINNWHREAWFKIVAPFSEASRDIICYKHFNESDLVNINGKHYLRKSINVLPCLKLDSKYPDRRVYLQSNFIKSLVCSEHLIFVIIILGVFAKLSADSVSGDKTYFKVKINDPYQAQIGKNEQVCYVIPDPQPIHNEHGYAKILGSSNKQCRSRLNVVKNCKKVFQTQSQNKSMVIIEQASKNNLQESVINKTTEKDSVKPPVETTQIIPTSIKPDVQCLMCLTTNPEVSVGTQGDLTLQSMLKVMVPYVRFFLLKFSII